MLPRIPFTRGPRAQRPTDYPHFPLRSGPRLRRCVHVQSLPEGPEGHRVGREAGRDGSGWRSGFEPFSKSHGRFLRLAQTVKSPASRRRGAPVERDLRARFFGGAQAFHPGNAPGRSRSTSRRSAPLQSEAGTRPHCFLHCSNCRASYRCSLRKSGRFVVMPSTPSAESFLASATSLTVHTQTFSPASFTRETNSSSIANRRSRSRPSRFADFAFTMSASAEVGQGTDG
jgi:hypothetical protein